MLKAALIALNLFTADPAALQSPVIQGSSFEELKGFKTVVLSQINASLGSENLPLAIGLPVEPGVYVTVTPERTLIFDRVVATVKNSQYVDDSAGAYDAGKFGDDRIGKECASGCSRSIFDAFYFSWLSLTQESQAIGTDVPNRVLFAVHSQLPAALLVNTAYGASESRPLQPPSLHLLLNGGAAAGLRSRPFYLLPPRGILVPPGQRILALTVKFKDDGTFVVSAADPRFGRTLKYSSPQELVAALSDVHRRKYPGKEVLILDVAESGTVEDVVNLMVAVQEMFPKVVLSNGQRVRIG